MVVDAPNSIAEALTYRAILLVTKAQLLSCLAYKRKSSYHDVIKCPPTTVSMRANTRDNQGSDSCSQSIASLQDA